MCKDYCQRWKAFGLYSIWGGELGVGPRTIDRYLMKAREQIKADWDIERPQMVADLLAQCSTLQMEARRSGQYHIALGAINTAAKLASLCS